MKLKVTDRSPSSVRVFEVAGIYTARDRVVQ